MRVFVSTCLLWLTSASAAAAPPAQSAPSEEEATRDPAPAKTKAPAKKSAKSKGTAKAQSKDRPKDKSKDKPKSSGAKKLPKTQVSNKAPECKYRTPVLEHTVEKGEHFGTIAKRYGISRTDLVELNSQLADPSLIRPGDKIRVCPKILPRVQHVSSHVVAPGETFGAIAKKYDLTVNELLELQEGEVEDPNLIRPGEKLRVVQLGEVEDEFKPTPKSSSKKLVSHRMPTGPGYVLKRPHLAYGTKRTVSLMTRIIDRYHRRANGGPAIHVGDISRKGGGRLTGHLSHRRGKDVDVGLVLKGRDANRTKFVRGTKSNLDVRRTWLLVHEFLRTGQVKYIFVDYSIQRRLYDYAKKHGVSDEKLEKYFQYPHGIGSGHGIIRHWRSHRDHLHVRFK